MWGNTTLILCSLKDPLTLFKDQTALKQYIFTFSSFGLYMDLFFLEVEKVDSTSVFMLKDKGTSLNVPIYIPFFPSAKCIEVPS